MPSAQPWVQCVATAAANGSAVANTTTTTTLLPTTALWGCPANFFSRAGQKFRIQAGGTIGTKSSTVGTLAIVVYMGSNAALTVTLASYSPPTSSLSSLACWQLEAIGTWLVTGAAGTASLQGTGWWSIMNGTTASSVASDTINIATVSSSIDTTVANTFDLRATWGTANASNTITLTTYSLETMN
jgi:hypothetical protein